MAYLRCYVEPTDEELTTALERNASRSAEVKETVRTILDAVKREGDIALYRYTKELDHVQLSGLEVTDEEIEEAENLVSDQLKTALKTAFSNIERFHRAQLPKEEHLQVQNGVFLSRKVVPLQRVGLYVPGGTAPLFSTVLMLAAPALVAGCPSVVLCTPADSKGSVHPAILYAAKLGKVDKIYKLGGAQAIGAMAYGTESIKKVDKIFGPGNQYVTQAKIQVSGECCAIDMPAGPSEVMVVASPQADATFVASDLLSQAEHGKDSQAMLVIVGGQQPSLGFLDAVEQALEVQMKNLERQQYLQGSLSCSRAFVVSDLERCALLVNAYAPEHLIINLGDGLDDQLVRMVVNAGSIFLGPYSCETAGDYASGTNHTLPTNGWARSYSGVSTDSFLKKITIQKLSKEGLENLAPTLLCMAEQEMLGAHRNAVSVRLGGSV